MAIQMIQTPRGQSPQVPGPLNLPPNFDQTKHAAKWVKQGPAVDAAAEREWIHGTPMTADGWQVWRDEGGTKGKPFTIALSSGVHVLLYRSRAVQNDVNAICGNVGKERLKAERRGETIAGVPVSDPGLLSDDRIAKVIGIEEQSEGDVIMNPVNSVEYPRVEAPTQVLKNS